MIDNIYVYRDAAGEEYTAGGEYAHATKRVDDIERELEKATLTAQCRRAARGDALIERKTVLKELEKELKVEGMEFTAGARARAYLMESMQWNVCYGMYAMQSRSIESRT